MDNYGGNLLIYKLIFVLGGESLPIWGRRKKEAQEALSSAKELIIKVKKKGIDTSQAEKLYKEAKKALKNRDYKETLEWIGKAEKSAKKAYIKGIRERLKLRISNLSNEIKDIKAKNLDTKGLNKLLNEAKESIKGGTKDYKQGLKAAKQGLKIAEERLEKFQELSQLISSTATMLRRIEDRSPDILMLKGLKERLSELEGLKAKGDIGPALKKAKKMNEEVANIKKMHAKAYESVKAFDKVLRDAEVLGASTDAKSDLKEAEELLRKGKFEEARENADKITKELSVLLKQYRDAKYHVDMAIETVSQAKKWGFSAFEAENALSLAKEALNKNDFENAIAKSKESKEKASALRERHKHSMELIKSAKHEVEKLRTKSVDISGLEEIIKEAENHSNEGDYGSSDEKIQRVFERIKEIG